MENDSLVLVSIPSGNVENLALLPMDMKDVDLAVSDGVLYLLNSFVNDRAEIATLSRSNYLLQSIDTLRYGGQVVEHAEGLAYLNGRLLAAFRDHPVPSTSNVIGDLSLDGELTNVYDYTEFDEMADCDGLTETSNGSLLWWDANPGDNNTKLVAVMPPSSPSYQILGQHSPYMTISDIAFTLSGELWGIDRSNRRLYQLDPATGSIIKSIAYKSSGPLVGLAAFRDDVAAIPTLSGRGLVILLIILIVGGSLSMILFKARNGAV
jgi:hypothetical protein